MKKRSFSFIIFLIFVISLLPLSAGAQEELAPAGDSPITDIFDIFIKFFGPLIEKISLKNLANLTDESEGILYAKILLFFLTFSILYYASSFVFKNATQGVQVGVPFIIAIMASLALPASLVITIFQAYSLVGAMMMWGIPILGMWYLNNKIFNKDDAFSYAGKFLTYLILMWLLTTMVTSLTNQYFSGQNFLSWFWLLYFIVVWGLVFNFIRLLGSLGGARGIGREIIGAAGEPAAEVRRERRERGVAAREAEGEVVERGIDRLAQLNRRIDQHEDRVLRNLAETERDLLVRLQRLGEDVRDMNALIRELEYIEGG